jgi:hypothetical protein
MVFFLKKREKGENKIITLLKDVLRYVTDYRKGSIPYIEDKLPFTEEVEDFFVWRAKRRIANKYGFFQCAVCKYPQFTVDEVEQVHYHSCHADIVCNQCRDWALNISLGVIRKGWV